MAISFAQAFANGVSACYDPSQIEALRDAICSPCAGADGTDPGCYKILPTGTPVSQFPLLGWGNIQPDPAKCPFLGVTVDCRLWLAPNDPSCDFTDPNIWVLIGGFIAAPKALYTYQASTTLPSTPDNGWFTLPLGVQSYNSMADRLEQVGDTLVFKPGNYVLESDSDWYINQTITGIKMYTRLYDLTHGTVVKLSNKAEMTGVNDSPSGSGTIFTTLQNHFRARISPTINTTYVIQHMSIGSDPSTFKKTGENNEVYVERDN